MLSHNLLNLVELFWASLVLRFDLLVLFSRFFKLWIRCIIDLCFIMNSWLYLLELLVYLVSLLVKLCLELKLDALKLFLETIQVFDLVFDLLDLYEVLVHLLVYVVDHVLVAIGLWSQLEEMLVYFLLEAINAQLQTSFLVLSQLVNQVLSMWVDILDLLIQLWSDSCLYLFLNLFLQIVYRFLNLVNRCKLLEHSFHLCDITFDCFQLELKTLFILKDLFVCRK